MRRMSSIGTCQILGRMCSIPDKKSQEECKGVASLMLWHLWSGFGIYLVRGLCAWYSNAGSLSTKLWELLYILFNAILQGRKQHQQRFTKHPTIIKFLAKTPRTLFDIQVSRLSLNVWLWNSRSVNCKGRTSLYKIWTTNILISCFCGHAACWQFSRTALFLPQEELKIGLWAGPLLNDCVWCSWAWSWLSGQGRNVTQSARTLLKGSACHLVRNPLSLSLTVRVTGHWGQSQPSNFKLTGN